MKHRPVLVVFCVLLASSGCGHNEPSRAEARTEAKGSENPTGGKEEKHKPGEVVLPAAAQQAGGIEVHMVEPRTVSETITATGQLTVNEDQTWTVGALLDGRVVSVGARVGDSVTAGQVLARIHSHEVHDARAAYKMAELELARNQAAVTYAERIRDRAQRLLDIKAGSRQELDAAEAELRNAQTAFRNAQVSVNKERTHIVEFLDIPLDDDDSKGNNPDDFVPVKAPAGGIVIERKATQGTVVSTGNELFRITSLKSVWMIVNVNEADLSRLRNGMTVRVLVRAFPERMFRGTILRAGEQLDPVTRTLQVRVLVPNPGGALKPEMFATAEIERGQSRTAIFVPESAAQDLNGARVVFVRTADDRFEARSIDVARTISGEMEVRAGLKAGEAVVTKGSFVLKSQLLKSSLAEEE